MGALLYLSLICFVTLIIKFVKSVGDVDFEIKDRNGPLWLLSCRQSSE